MEWVVITGKTVDEAKEAALDELGVDAVDAEFEVLEEPRQGLFGRVRGEARIRARVRPTAPRPKADRRDRRRRESSESNTRSTDDGGAAPPAKAAPTRRPRAAPTPAPVVGTPATSTVVTTAAPVVRAGRRTSRTPVLVKDLPDHAERPPATQAHGGTSVPEDELSLAEQGKVAEEFLAGLIERFGSTAETTVVVGEDETIEVQVGGAELGLLIGPKGQTLQAVQEMTRTVVQRRSVARTGRIYVDIAGYRVRRREALARFTMQVADDVRATGVQRVLEPMNAADRKVVHDTANDIDGVRTISEGEDPGRRVVILPDLAGAPAPAQPEPGLGDVG